jgi:hypothetical protein
MRIFIFAIFFPILSCARDTPAKNVSGTLIHEYVELDWNYSFGIPKEITLHHMGDSVWLLAKEIGKETNPLKREKRNYEIGPGGQTDTIFYYQKLSLEKWGQIDSLLNATNFWTLPQDIKDKTIDGTYWTFTAHSNGKYHIIGRCSPLETNLKAIALFMIQVAGYDDTIH